MFYNKFIFQSVYSDGSSDFEDDDVYEDVVHANEDNISKELEFINQNFNFTRSLWCEIPEVKKSTVLSKFLVLFDTFLVDSFILNQIIKL